MSDAPNVVEADNVAAAADTDNVGAAPNVAEADNAGDAADTDHVGAAHNLTRSTVLATRLETADGLWGRFMGLMGRASLDDGAGLWLSGTNGIHMMFMRFPIDAVFLGKPLAADGGAQEVLSVHRGLRAWFGLVPLVRGAFGVLELPVGTIERTGTVVGDRVVLVASGG